MVIASASEERWMVFTFAALNHIAHVLEGRGPPSEDAVADDLPLEGHARGAVVAVEVPRPLALDGRGAGGGGVGLHPLRLGHRSRSRATCATGRSPRKASNHAAIGAGASPGGNAANAPSTSSPATRHARSASVTVGKRRPASHSPTGSLRYPRRREKACCERLPRMARRSCRATRSKSVMAAFSHITVHLR